jgi:hypothetical protein
MISVDDLKKQFYEKLASSGSLDHAFTKAVWIAFLIGYEEGKNVANSDTSSRETRL